MIANQKTFKLPSGNKIVRRINGYGNMSIFSRSDFETISKELYTNAMIDCLKHLNRQFCHIKGNPFFFNSMGEFVCTVDIKEFIRFVIDNSTHNEDKQCYVPKYQHHSIIFSLLGRSFSTLPILSPFDVEELRKKLTLSFIEEILLPLPKFNVGDIVYCDPNLEGELDSYPYKGDGYVSGEVFEVMGIADGGWVYKKAGIGSTRVMPYALVHASNKQKEAYILLKANQLPVINGHEGKLIKNDTMLKYGCAEIPVSWFDKGTNRTILSMTLNTGVKLSSDNIKDIQRFLSNQYD